jgi:hypothetical protein
VRQAKHGAVTKLPCGCHHDDIYWLTLCVEHKRETDEIHKTWADQHSGIPLTPNNSDLL